MISALSNLLSDGVVAHHPPFFQSGAGIVTLMLLTALTTGAIAFAFKAVPEWRRGMREQTLILRDLQNAISPKNRPGIVERVEAAERDIAIIKDREHRSEDE